MKCLACNSDMIHYDDSGSFTTNNQNWDSYKCTNCSTTVDITTVYGKVTITWLGEDTLEKGFYDKHRN